MTLKDWEEKRDVLAFEMKKAWDKRGNEDGFKAEATAALEFLGIKKPVESDKNGHFQHGTSGRYCPTENFNFCPICSKPRPGTESKPIQLPHKINDNGWGTNLSMIVEPVNKLIDAVDQFSRRMK